MEFDSGFCFSAEFNVINPQQDVTGRGICRTGPADLTGIDRNGIDGRAVAAAATVIRYITGLRPCALVHSPLCCKPAVIRRI